MALIRWLALGPLKTEAERGARKWEMFRSAEDSEDTSCQKREIK
jgi:hypothetical protein